MKKLLIGCGITVLVLAAVGFGASFYLVNKLKQELAVGEQVQVRREHLRETYGQPGSYTPTTSLRPDRYARYLEIREAVHEYIEPRLADAEEQLTRAEGQTEQGGLLEKIRGVSNMMRGGVGALKVGLSAMAVRDSLLLEADMPEGEYIYYHCLAVYSWLRWTPPERTGESRLIDDEDWDQAVRESREELRAAYLDILRNQASALGERDDLTPDEQAYRTVLEEQLERRWRRTDEWPLQGALPEAMVASMAASESRLRATLPRTTVEFFVDTMATHMEVEDERGLQVHFD